MPLWPTLEAAGARLAFIGSGSAFFAAGFRAEFGVPAAVPVLVDDARVSYAALGFVRGVGSVLRPSVLAAGLRAAAAGNRQTRTAGDPLQQGGVRVVARGGRVVYAQDSAFAGDHPPVEAVIAAALAAAPGGSGAGG